MPALARLQAGFKSESTYGTAVTVDRFAPIVSDSVHPKHTFVESSSMGWGEAVKPSGIEPRVKLGAGGEIVMEVFSKGFGWWLLHMLGSLSTGAQGGDGEYAHTGTIATLLGDSFTYQGNRPLHPSDADQAFTFEGGKILKWKCEFEVGKPVVFTFDTYFEDYSTATALASRSIPSGLNLLTWAQAKITVGGSDFYVKKGSIECDNGFVIDDDRGLQDSSLIRQPQQRKRREIKWELETEFASLTQFNRFASTTGSGASAALVFRAQGPSVIGGTTYPSLSITVDEASFDEHEAPVKDAGPIVEKLTGRGLYDLSNAPLTVVYTSADATA